MMGELKKKKRVGERERGKGVVTQFKKEKTQYKVKANSVSMSALKHIVNTISNQFRLV
uniref:Uncharacterized protein n=1 Tax=Daphnia magna TaxID=35525 RepID=A0A0P5XVP9_9CRUS